MQTRPPTRRAPGGRPVHRQAPRGRFSALLTVLVVLTAAIVSWRTHGFGLFSPNGPLQAATTPSDGGSNVSRPGSSGSNPTPGRSGSSGPTQGALAATPGPINTKYPGLTTFRGNATRDYYGAGPVPAHPVVRWRYPTSGGLCSTPHDLFRTPGSCGAGWAGPANGSQPPRAAT